MALLILIIDNTFVTSAYKLCSSVSELEIAYSEVTQLNTCSEFKQEGSITVKLHYMMITSVPSLQQLSVYITNHRPVV